MKQFLACLKPYRKETLLAIFCIEAETVLSC